MFRVSDYGGNYFEFVCECEWEWECIEPGFTVDPDAVCFDCILLLLVLFEIAGLLLLDYNKFEDYKVLSPKLNAPEAYTNCKYPPWDTFAISVSKSQS